MLTYLTRNLRRQRFVVQEKPHCHAKRGYETYLVTKIVSLGLVIDAQIVGEPTDLERARTAKISKYAINPDIERTIHEGGCGASHRHQLS